MNVKEFTLEIDLFVTFVDGCVCYAIRSNVKELKLKFFSSNRVYKWYDLSGLVLSAKTLHVLKLRGCKLELPRNIMKLSSLRKLNLSRVYIDDHMIENLVEGFHSLSKLLLILHYDEFSYKQMMCEENTCCKSFPISCWERCMEEVELEVTTKQDTRQEEDAIKCCTFKGPDILEKIDAPYRGVWDIFDHPFPLSLLHSSFSNEHRLISNFKSEDGRRRFGKDLRFGQS
ncbi:hypothetical protein EZV62_003504 [Acer yangbiense]|uniref:F-box/LRR-repeat protein 15/At3g58940/PEG3-like LRR domain-containing protein n=1 Tax=Acer yangbiense TaxID=1000413 RepID=A0A5C7IHL8_9ROSI|nr:hypothetical protein EZV62_003504 [Acer yangbiense]